MATDVQQATGSPRVEVLTALRRHWFVALLPVVVFVAGAVTLGLRRPVQYTTTANLTVGHVYVNNPAGIPTVVEATRSLAGVYSRAIDSTTVRADARRRLAKAGVRVSGSLSATPIPDSPLIKVTAESASRQGAIALANAGSEALAVYVNRQIRDNDAATLLASRYRTASLRYRRRRETRDDARRAYVNNPSRERKADLDRAAASAETALLRRDALRASYQEAVRGGTSSIGVDIFSWASSATSDRLRVMQLLVFVGLIGGLATGTALAVLLAAREFRRYGR